MECLGFNFWSIKFGEEWFEARVTNRASMVDSWIAKTIRIHSNRLHKLIVGLDTEWTLPTTKTNKYQKVAILQICVGKQCLIFQLSLADRIPQSLIDFLGNKNLTFVGKGIQTDADKLYNDYRLEVCRTMDVACMAALKYHDEDLYDYGLKRLVLKFLDVEMDKSKRITLSKWDEIRLSKKQIQYAAIDAYVSFKIALKLMEVRA